MECRSWANPNDLGPLPEDWSLKTIEELCERVTSGGTPSRRISAFFENGVINWFKTKELRDGYLDESEERITIDAVNASSAKLLPPDTVLMAMYGDGRTITNLGILRHESTCNQACCAMICDQSMCDSRFLFYALKHHRDDFIQIASGGAQRNLSGGLIRRFAIKTPPLAEQHTIAHILGILDDKIELNRKMNATLDEIARTLFTSWFVDFDPVRVKAEGRQPEGMDAETAALFPDRFVDSELGPIPEGWDVVSVYELASVAYGAPFASSRFNSGGLGEPLLRIRDLATHSPKVYTDEVHPRAVRIQAGDLVVGMDGEFRAHLWTGPASLLNQRVCRFEPRPGVPKALVRYGIERWLNLFERSKSGTTVIHLGKSDIDTFRLLRPSQKVCERFGELTDSLYDQIVLNSAQSSTLATVRDALLPELLSGRFLIPIGDGVPEVL